MERIKMEKSCNILMESMMMRISMKVKMKRMNSLLMKWRAMMMKRMKMRKERKKMMKKTTKIKKYNFYRF